MEKESEQLCFSQTPKYDKKKQPGRGWGRNSMMRTGGDKKRKKKKKETERKSRQARLRASTQTPGFRSPRRSLSSSPLVLVLDRKEW